MIFTMKMGTSINIYLHAISKNHARASTVLQDEVLNFIKSINKTRLVLGHGKSFPTLKWYSPLIKF